MHRRMFALTYAMTHAQAHLVPAVDALLAQYDLHAPEEAESARIRKGPLPGVFTSMTREQIGWHLIQRIEDAVPGARIGQLEVTFVESDADAPHVKSSSVNVRSLVADDGLPERDPAHDAGAPEAVWSELLRRARAQFGDDTKLVPFQDARGRWHVSIVCRQTMAQYFATTQRWREIFHATCDDAQSAAQETEAFMRGTTQEARLG